MKHFVRDTALKYNEFQYYASILVFNILLRKLRYKIYENTYMRETDLSLPTPTTFIHNVNSYCLQSIIKFISLFHLKI